MSRHDTDEETFWRLMLIGESLDEFDGGLHATAAHSRADTTEVPDGVSGRGD